MSKSNKKSQQLEVVSNSPVQQAAASIPLDPRAKASAGIKSYIENIIQQVVSRKNTLENEKVRSERRDLLEKYKATVGFSEIRTKLMKAKDGIASAKEQGKKLIDEARKKADELEKKATALFDEVRSEMLNIGLDTTGDLLNPRKSAYYDNDGNYSGERWMVDNTYITDKAASRIKEIKDVIAAVGESNVIVTDDQVLKVRLLAATTVGECIAIVNAVAGEDLFNLGAIPGVTPIPALTA